MGDNFGIHRAAPGAASTRASSGNVAAADDRTQGQVLSDFLLQLEDYTPTVNTLLLCPHYTIVEHDFPIVSPIRFPMPSLHTI